MVTYKCDVCGREFHDERQLITGKTYTVEHHNKTLDRWHGDVCKDCNEEMMYVAERAMLDWLTDTQKEMMANAGDR